MPDWVSHPFLDIHNSNISGSYLSKIHKVTYSIHILAKHIQDFLHIYIVLYTYETERFSIYIYSISCSKVKKKKKKENGIILVLIGDMQLTFF